MQPCRSSRSSSGPVAHKRATVPRGILVNDVQPACGSMPGEVRRPSELSAGAARRRTWGVVSEQVWQSVTRHDHETRAQWAAELVLLWSYFTAVAGSLSVRVAASLDNTRRTDRASTTRSLASAQSDGRPSNYCDHASVILRETRPGLRI